MKQIIIGITGGTGSGKSTISNKLLELTGKEKALHLKQDNYYKDQSHLPFEDRAKTNYDHPDAFDNDLMVQHILQLKKRKTIEVPTYDFSNHTRRKETLPMESKEIILIEGILILAEERIRNLLDIKLFVDTESDIRILRRIKRDMKDRGRTLDSVVEQYYNSVRPAHIEFVEPSKRYADLIIPEGGNNVVAIGLLATKIQSVLEENKSLTKMD